MQISLLHTLFYHEYRLPKFSLVKLPKCFNILRPSTIFIFIESSNGLSPVPRPAITRIIAAYNHLNSDEQTSVKFDSKGLNSR